jgi:inosose dehydratase
MAPPITRRGALKHAALASVGLHWLSRASYPRAAAWEAASSTPPRRGSLKLGVAGYSLRLFSLDAAIGAMRRLGLSYASLSNAHVPWDALPTRWSSGARKFRDAGITPLSCGVMYLKNTEASMRQAFEYARAVGVPTLVCHPDAEAFPLLERFVRAYDVKAAIHHHGPEDTVYPSPRDAWNAVQPYDKRIGLCIDVGHTARAGVDPAEAIRNYRERLYDVHLKDTTAAVGAEDTPVEVGRGRVDHRAIVGALLDIGYSYLVALEFEKDPADPLPGLAESVGYVRGMLADMGLR